MRDPQEPPAMHEPQLPETNRRGFLALLGSGAAWASLARSGSALGALAQLRAAPAGAAPEAECCRFFDDRERRILARVMERMVGAGEDGLPSVDATRSLETLDRLCAGLDPELTRPLPSLLRLVDWAPLIFDLRWPRYTRAGDEACDASLRSWMESRFALRRQAFLALRNLSFLGYYSQPETWPAIGYAGPLLSDPAADRDPVS